MGNKVGKAKKPASKLSNDDIRFLTKQTGMSKEKIEELFYQFNKNNPDGLLDKKKFTLLYGKLRSEPFDSIKEIAGSVFNAFDKDKNGFVSFHEFMVSGIVILYKNFLFWLFYFSKIGYALTSRGEVKDKLEFAFEAYDANNSKTLDSEELNAVISGMLDLLGADKNGFKIKELVDACMADLNVSKNGVITKDEFVDGLLKNYSLRMLMSPFN